MKAAGYGLLLGVIIAAGGWWLLQEVAERRDSAYYAWVARAIGPVSARIWRDRNPATIAPYREDFDGPTLAGDWQILHTDMMQWELREGALIARTLQECVWWRNEQAPMFARSVDGDFDLTAGVRTRKASDPTAFLDSNWQFGGIMVRDPRGDAWFSRESYVFNVIGYRGSGLQVETKNTVQARSKVHSVNWPSGNALLRIRRSGDRFELFASEDGENWTAIVEYRRADLPPRLQVGLILYSASAGTGFHDLEVAFDYFAVATAVPGALQK